jgi:hypothetical protein
VVYIDTYHAKNPNSGIYVHMFLRALEMEIVDKFHVHLIYFVDIWYNLWPFGIISGS